VLHNLISKVLRTARGFLNCWN